MNTNEKLMEATRWGSAADVERYLGQASCNPLVTDNSGRSALMWAAYYGNEVCLNVLLPRSDPLSKDIEHQTALMFAAGNGHEDCVKILLPLSDLLARNNRGLSAGQLARECGHHALAELISAHMAQSEATLLAGQVLQVTQDLPKRTSVPRI